MPRIKKRPYKSLVRKRQAGDTRRRIVEATRQLLLSKGYAGMTITAIAQRAEVSAQSVYAIFKSKTGILTELDIVTTVCIGLLIGSEFAVSVFINPILRKLDDLAQANAIHLFARRLGIACLSGI